MNKEFLNEENYQKGKKSVTKLAIIILVGGLLLGGGLIATGIIKSANIKEPAVEEINKGEIQSQIDTLEDELIPLKAQKNKEFKENQFSEEYYRLDTEISRKERKISELREEIWDAENSHSSFSKDFERSKYVPLYMFGAFIIISTLMTSGYVYMIAKRREIFAFTTQQVMPVAQEGMEKMAPTLGKVGKGIAEEMVPAMGKIGKEMAKEMAPAYGEVAKEISKGIKEGLKDKEK